MHMDMIMMNNMIWYDIYINSTSTHYMLYWVYNILSLNGSVFEVLFDHETTALLPYRTYIFLYIIIYTYATYHVATHTNMVVIMNKKIMWFDDLVENGWDICQWHSSYTPIYFRLLSYHIRSMYARMRHSTCETITLIMYTFIIYPYYTISHYTIRPSKRL